MSLSFAVCPTCDEVEPITIRVESGANRVVARYSCSALAQKPALVRSAKFQPLKAEVHDV